MSDQNKQSQEKSHEASPAKLERARKKGDLPRSQDVQTAAAYIGFAIVILLAGGWGGTYLGETLMAFLAHPADLAALFTQGGAVDAGLAVSGRIGLSVFALFVVPALLILTLLITQRAVVLAPQKLTPKFSRINPVANAKQKYGPNGLFEFAKSFVKLVAISVILGIAITGEIDRLPAYVHITERALPLLLLEQFWNVMIGVLIFALAVGAIDFLWQRHSHLRKMRMTHQEVKDESKQSEGDPQMRASRRDRGREIANNRMLHDVQTADVVIVNPTHYAVALKWSRVEKSVPICVAKGADELARRIRVRAEQDNVPIHSDPPTARSLHALVDVGKQIQPEHYKAVAAAIVFADQLRAKKRERDALLGP
ncbi:MAG: flagellar type III secretion system protein FlhB [Pseudomonadota bacterium]